MTTPTPQPACSPSPGPWEQAPYILGVRRAVIDSEGVTVADIYGRLDPEEAEANAQLIARAPETARLLGELVERVGDYEHLLADAQSSAFDAGDEKEQAYLDGMIGLFDATFTPLLTQIQKLEG